MDGINKMYGLEKSMSKTIYVSVPSVEDSEIFNTINGCFDMSDNPDNIFIGCCHSIPFNNQKIINEIEKKLNKKNISNKYINMYRNIGVGYGRKNSMSMYSGQDYVLQIDAHTNFEKSWDSILLDAYESIPNKKEKTIISGYLSGYSILENNKRDIKNNGRPLYPIFISGYENNFLNVYIGEDRLNYWKLNYSPIPMWMTPEDINFYNFLPDKKYIKSRKINANFIFSNKNFANDYHLIVPWNFLFYEEEFIMSIEAFNLNYDFIFPNMELPITHLYFDQFNEFYNNNSRKTLNPDIETSKKSIKKIKNYFKNEKNKEKIKKYCIYAGLEYPSYDTIDPFYIPLEN